MRDRIYFAADSTAASDLGVSRRTIIRWRKSLEADGRIERAGVHRWGPRKTTVIYRFCGQRVTQRTSCQRAKTPRAGIPRTNRTVGSCSGARALGRRRRLMEQHPEVIKGGIERASGEVTPFNAGDAVAAVAELFTAEGVPLIGQIRARLGKAAKSLLDDDFPPDVVVSAMVIAVKTRMFGSTETIAQEMMLAQAGQLVSREEYRSVLATTNHKVRHSDSPVWKALRQEMERRSP